VQLGEIAAFYNARHNALVRVTATSPEEFAAAGNTLDGFRRLVLDRLESNAGNAIHGVRVWQDPSGNRSLDYVVSHRDACVFVDSYVRVTEHKDWLWRVHLLVEAEEKPENVEAWLRAFADGGDLGPSPPRKVPAPRPLGRCTP
jgi:hypothetical protein